MRVGSLVECINSNGYNCPQLVQGQIYTVRAVVVCNCGECKNPLLHLEEIKLDHNPFTGEEYAFDSEDFREVQPPLNISNLVENIVSQTV